MFSVLCFSSHFHQRGGLRADPLLLSAAVLVLFKINKLKKTLVDLLALRNSFLVAVAKSARRILCSLGSLVADVH